MKQPDFFGNIPPNTPFQTPYGLVGTRENGCFMVGDKIYWTLEAANNQFLCYPVTWTKTMMHSYGKYWRRIARLRSAELNVIYRPKWLKNSY